MLTAAASILLMMHLLAMNLAGAGPLLCVWLQAWGSHGNQMAGLVGRQTKVIFGFHILLDQAMENRMRHRIYRRKIELCGNVASLLCRSLLRRNSLNKFFRRRLRDGDVSHVRTEPRNPRQSTTTLAQDVTQRTRTHQPFTALALVLWKEELVELVAFA